MTSEAEICPVAEQRFSHLRTFSNKLGIEISMLPARCKRTAIDCPAIYYNGGYKDCPIYKIVHGEGR